MSLTCRRAYLIRFKPLPIFLITLGFGILTGFVLTRPFTALGFSCLLDLGTSFISGLFPFFLSAGCFLSPDRLTLGTESKLSSTLAIPLSILFDSLADANAGKSNTKKLNRRALSKNLIIGCKNKESLPQVVDKHSFMKYVMKPLIMRAIYLVFLGLLLH